MSDTQEIKKLVKENALIIGTKAVSKALAQKTIDTIWTASTADPKTRAELKAQAQMSDATLKSLDLSSHDLGILCKKQFGTSVVAKVKVN